MSSHEKPILSDSRVAEADLSAKQGYAVTPGAAATGAALANLLGEHVTGILGLLKNKPESGEEAAIAMLGIYPGKLSGTVSQMDSVTADADGKILRARPGDWAMGYAVKAGVSGDECPIWLHPHNPVDMYFTAEDILTAGLGVVVDETAGEVDLPGAAAAIIGVTLAAAGAGDQVRVRTYGVALVKAGGAGFTCGDKLMVESDGEFIAATGAGAFVVAVALATASGGATAAAFIRPFGVTVS